MNVRIGTDILLRVKLKVKKPNDSVNIKSLRAFIINTTKEQQIAEDLRKKTRFMGRFPHEPFMCSYESTAYDIKSEGCPVYRAYPVVYRPMPYCGFGVYPKWDNIYKHECGCLLTEYRAHVRATSKNNVVEVFFPAEEQLFVGTYKLTIVAKVYQPGYDLNNLRTITMDWSDVFTLVDNSDGTDSPVEIDLTINPDNPAGTTPDSDRDVYVESGSIADANTLLLNRSDAEDVSVDISDITGWDEME